MMALFIVRLLTIHVNHGGGCRSLDSCCCRKPFKSNKSFSGLLPRLGVYVVLYRKGQLCEPKAHNIHIPL